MSGLLLAEEAAEAASRFQNVATWLARPEGRLVVSAILGGGGLWWLMPGPRSRLRILGGLSLILSGVGFVSLAPLMNDVTQILFSMLSGLTLVAAVMTVTMKNPVYAAIWFAVVLLGTGGLMLVNGAQFLGIATVAVYAGAIVVTFLFVLMLAQPEGHAFYDRIGWGHLSQLIGCLAGAALAAVLIWAALDPVLIASSDVAGIRAVDNPQHVAALGGQLFTKHLVAVQVAGALLLAALVAAVSMAAQGTNRPTMLRAQLDRALRAEGGASRE